MDPDSVGLDGPEPDAAVVFLQGLERLGARWYARAGRECAPRVAHGAPTHGLQPRYRAPGRATGDQVVAGDLSLREHVLCSPEVV